MVAKEENILFSVTIHYNDDGTENEHDVKKRLRGTMDIFSQAQLERLNYIEFRLYFTGQVGRNDLKTRFGIKDAAATRDISIYREHAPNNIIYDTTAKTYQISDRFSRHFLKSAQPKDLLLALVHGIGDDFTSTRPTSVVACELPSRLHPPKIDIFAYISRAIYSNKPIEITYVSGTSGESTRIIVPLCLAGNGLRWHTRAYDRKRGGFYDFVINRIKKVRILADEVVESSEALKNDTDWNTFVELEIAAHPKYGHKEAIELEHGMKEGILKHKVRAAMAAYILRLWNVDCSSDPKKTTHGYQLWLKNRRDVELKADLQFAPGFSPSS